MAGKLPNIYERLMQKTPERAGTYAKPLADLTDPQKVAADSPYLKKVANTKLGLTAPEDEYTRAKRQSDNAEKAYLGSLSDVYNLLKTKSKTPEEIAQDERKAKKRALATSVFEGLSGIANLITASQGAPQVFTPSQIKSPKMLEAWKQKKAEYDASNLAAAKANVDLLGQKYKLSKGKESDILGVRAAAKKQQLEERKVGVSEMNARTSRDKMLKTIEDSNRKFDEMVRHHKATEGISRSKGGKDASTNAYLIRQGYEEGITSIFNQIDKNDESVQNAGRPRFDPVTNNIEGRYPPTISEMRTAIDDYVRRTGDPKIKKEYESFLRYRRIPSAGTSNYSASNVADVNTTHKKESPTAGKRQSPLNPKKGERSNTTYRGY